MTKKIPMRQCIGCGQMKSKKELLRILKTPEGEITMDVTGRKNGRGAYLCISGECLQDKGFRAFLPDEDPAGGL